MNCPKCGTPNASFVDDKGKSRNKRRKTFDGGQDKGSAWKRMIENDKIKCKKCGIF